jgi:hypothetical protein
MPLGIKTLVKLAWFANARASMAITLLGIVTLVKFVTHVTRPTSALHPPVVRLSTQKHLKEYPTTRTGKHRLRLAHPPVTCRPRGWDSPFAALFLGGGPAVRSTPLPTESGSFLLVGQAKHVFHPLCHTLRRALCRASAIFDEMLNEVHDEVLRKRAAGSTPLNSLVFKRCGA